MPKPTGEEFPERPLMSTLSDLLGIPHFTTSRGSTVRVDFLRAVVGALDRKAEGLGKDQLIRVAWEAVNDAPMPADRLSRGGTVTNRVLREIVDGVLRTRLGEQPAEQPVSHDLMEELQVVFDPASYGDERTCLAESSGSSWVGFW